MRVIYAAGPGHIMRTYQFWAAGLDDPQEVAVTYSSQFFDICRELECDARVIGYNENPGFMREGHFWVQHRPMFPRKSSGIIWHFAQILWGIRFICSAIRFRANVAVISGGSHWFVFSLLSLFGIKLIPTLHCVFWAKRKPIKRSWRIIHWLDARLFRRSASAILSLSNDITTQLKVLTGGETGVVIPFLPFYRRTTFDGIAACVHARPFRVLYAGRIVRSKGVFDVLETAKRLQMAGRTTIEFDLCGSGADLDELRTAATSAGIEARFRCHGHCSRDQMRGFYGRSQIVVAPTRTDFVEGFNKVVAEAILAGRPVITSDICPALEYVDAAVLEVPPDDVMALEKAIVRLADDVKLFEQKVDACGRLRELFLSEASNWASALRRALQVADSRTWGCKGVKSEELVRGC